jgi:hypothetical protein
MWTSEEDKGGKAMAMAKRMPGEWIGMAMNNEYGNSNGDKDGR